MNVMAGPVPAIQTRRGRLNSAGSLYYPPPPVFVGARHTPAHDGESGTERRRYSRRSSFSVSTEPSMPARKSAFMPAGSYIGLSTHSRNAMPAGSPSVR